MKILLLGKYYYPYVGGVENHLYLLSTGLVELGNDVTVSVSNTNMKFSKERISGVTVFRCPKLFSILNAPIALLKVPSRKNFDVIHVHLPNPMASIYALVHYKENIVVTYHSDIIKEGLVSKILNFFYDRLVLYPLLDRANSVIATSTNYVSGSKILQKYKHKIKIVPNCIDLSLFRLNKRDAVLLRNLKSKYRNKKILLFVGRLVPYKGLEYLIKAMSEIVNSFNDVKLLIIGDGPLSSKLRTLVKNLDLSNSIEFIPESTDRKLKLYYHLSDILVLPSTYKAEAFGIVQLEAMSCGKPIVSTNIAGSGVSFVNKNDETGLVVEPCSSKQLAVAISKLLRNPFLRKKLGKNGLARVRKYFSKKVLLKNILSIYYSISKHH